MTLIYRLTDAQELQCPHMTNENAASGRIKVENVEIFRSEAKLFVPFYHSVHAFEVIRIASD